MKQRKELGHFRFFQKYAALKYVCISVCLFFSIYVKAQKKEVFLTIHPNQVIGKIDDKIYGLLLEHLYHSVSNGIWGETVWNRSFEELYAVRGDWSVNNENLIRVEAFKGETALFRIGRGRNFELSLEFKKTAGEGDITFCLRDQHRETMLTNGVFVHLGAKGNKVHELETKTGWIWHTPTAKTEIADSKTGNLLVNTWQRLNIICNDGHVTCSIDDKLLFEEQIENCPKEGAIRIGAKNCKAQFRNIKIKSLDNTEIQLKFNPFRHWSLIGKGNITTVQKDVLNHNHAVYIQSFDNMAGVEQPKNYRIREDDVLQGSLYLKGNISRVKVQLLNGSSIIAEQSITGINNKWNVYPLKFSTHVNCDSATLRIITQEKGNLFIDQVSLMHQSSLDIEGYRPDLLGAVKELKPTIIRWPGGSFVEHYNFENGIGPQYQRKGILRWDDFDPLSFGTDEFMAFCKRIGAEPNIVVPIGYHNYQGYAPNLYGETDWLQKALNWLEYCNGDSTTPYGAKRAANGHPEPYNVKYWEIDNEVWKMDPKLYARLARTFSLAMKQKDPSIKIIACGSGRLGKEGVGLDSIMISDVAEHIDYISPHHYMELNKFGNDGVAEYGNYLKQLAAWISKSKNPKMKIYVSEWNLEKTDMRTGLFAGGILNLFEQLPSVEMAAPALALRHTSAGGWDNAFINFDQNGYFVAPNYLVMKLWRDHYAPNRIGMEGDMKNLSTVATKSADGKTVYVKIVNPTENTVDLQLILDGSNQFRLKDVALIASSSLEETNSLKRPEAIKVQKGKAAQEKNIIRYTMPRYGVAVFTVVQD